MGNKAMKSPLLTCDVEKFVGFVNGDTTAEEVGLQDIRFTLDTWLALAEVVPNARRTGLEARSGEVDDIYAQVLIRLGFTLPRLTNYKAYIKALRRKMSDRASKYARLRTRDYRHEDLSSILLEYKSLEKENTHLASSGLNAPNDHRGSLGGEEQTEASREGPSVKHHRQPLGTVTNEKDLPPTKRDSREVPSSDDKNDCARLRKQQRTINNLKSKNAELATDYQAVLDAMGSLERKAAADIAEKEANARHFENVAMQAVAMEEETRRRAEIEKIAWQHEYDKLTERLDQAKVELSSAQAESSTKMAKLEQNLAETRRKLKNTKARETHAKSNNLLQAKVAATERELELHEWKMNMPV
uniref:Uncharacterized protein n=1 Tax=Pyramimonas obovata TaxID=1411642 RepID=A0A7S0N1D1_9CHLO|mmetsp:Transcript_18359/g.40126  ORF Transcript_18359/g.40126 Transcript_18359/m.40126 type:complete len:358 (+) Transcript_18359:24-1097(+)|eukprot:CAMPEP_0118922552 /NCGR_PEP_ID=MMETSP1169-20130426/1444_1 /TAXON_ID=36882 /ORGANISM="Pyramimonas obovata, Strain CCMP722" /LENGTH=357 /DNA_ID=CAMNT_0006863443 /DNA_START=19 /DNA_END=1092 /DNA_ORIENTATION=+